MFQPLFFTALLCSTSFLHAKVHSIEDFGGKADGVTDNGPALAKAFAFAKENPGTTLSLGGVCRVMTPQTKDSVGTGLPMAAGAEGVSGLTIQFDPTSKNREGLTNSNSLSS
jgi:hypothetical protein